MLVELGGGGTSSRNDADGDAANSRGGGKPAQQQVPAGDSAPAIRILVAAHTNVAVDRVLLGLQVGRGGREQPPLPCRLPHGLCMPQCLSCCGPTQA